MLSAEFAASQEVTFTASVEKSRSRDPLATATDDPIPTPGITVALFGIGTLAGTFYRWDLGLTTLLGPTRLLGNSGRLYSLSSHSRLESHQSGDQTKNAQESRAI